MKNWYIVQSHSNFENKVAGLIKEEAEKAKISDKIEEIVVPTHDVTEVKRGKRIQRKKKYFPGYVLIKSEMDNDLYHMIKNLKRVSGFLGSKGIPVPVSDKEIEKILGQIKDGVAQPKSGIEYSIGEKVQVVDGPFASFSGMVEDIDEEKIITQMANPITHLNSNTPPFLIFHGAKDTAVPVCQSEILHEALLNKGLKSRLIIEEEGVHSGTNGKMFAQKNLDLMTDFIMSEYQKSKTSKR